MLSTILRATFLDSSVFPELKGDQSAFRFALVAAIAAASAYSVGVWAIAFEKQGRSDPLIVPAAFITVLVGWVIWTGVNYLVGVRLLGGTSDYRQLLSALGISYGPGVLMFAAAVPGAGPTVFTFASLWTLAAGVVAMRATQEIGWINAAIPTLFGWIPGFVLALSIVNSAASA